MLNAVRLFRPFLFVLMLATAGCHAQAPNGGKLSPELARRVEILIRSKTNLPPNYDMIIGQRTHSDVPGFDEIMVLFSAEGKTSKPMVFLLSNDGKTLAQFTKFDISKDPRSLVSDAGRPARGGPANAFDLAKRSERAVADHDRTRCWPPPNLSPDPPERRCRLYPQRR